jgi:murein DD-endopeptidase MepM/ murein hydrolase activator NlpD
VGRTRSEDGTAADLAADPSAGDWDWDAAWAATQDQVVDDDTAASTLDEQVEPEAGRPRRSATARAALRRPPGRRAPLLLAAAVAGALLTGLLGGWGGGGAAPVASGQDYGLGVSDASFSGGVDVAGARGEISEAEAQARLGEIAASRAAREPDFVVPTDGRLTTCFCQRWGTMHWGIDLAAPLGTPIYAAADGVVLRAGPASGYGNAVYIQDADGNVQIYGHMKYYNVQAGDVVSAGEQIAKVGSQGQSTGPHLHFEIHAGGMNGKPIDPEDWLADRGLTVG